jgi:cyclopropane fatty-acyl-phospholipid synthase-like methyltransferase
MPPSAAEKAVQDYYDRNTRRFLRLGASRKELTIHRAVWGKGVKTRSEALETTSRLILTELNGLAGAQPRHVIDLGCGVGGTLFYLAQHSAQPLRASGVTLSPVQARLAREYARGVGGADGITFYTASYLDLPALPPADLAVAVESFILGPDPAVFFRSAASALRPGGRLVLVDDFLSARAAVECLHPRQEQWIAAFRAGWHANSLLTPTQAAALGASAGLHLCRDHDLTPDLHLLSPRDRLVNLTLALGRLLPLRALLGGDYWDSLAGGSALQDGLRARVFEYHWLVFERD